MRVGDLVTHGEWFIEEYGIEADEVGIVLELDPEDLGVGAEEVLVLWNDSELCNHSAWNLEVISESR